MLWAIAQQWAKSHPGSPVQIKNAEDKKQIRMHRHWALKELEKIGAAICYRCLINAKFNISRDYEVAELLKDKEVIDTEQKRNENTTPSS